MGTSDRICPTHKDVGALPHHNNCPQCGKALVMKGTFQTAGENIIHGAALGLGLGAGMELGRNIVDGVGDVVGGLFD